MVGIDFPDEKNGARWFKEQGIAPRCVIASRAALRAVSNVILITDAQRQPGALASLRAILTSSVYGKHRREGLGELELALRSAFHAAQSGFGSAITPSFNATLSAAEAAGSGARFQEEVVDGFFAGVHDEYHAADSVACSVISIATSARSSDVESARTAAHSAVSSDTKEKLEVLGSLPVWAGAEVPAAIAANHAAFLTYLQSHEDWRFWHRWYSQMWEGTFTDWDLAIAVAKIPDAVWDEGLGAVADAIREIEAELLVARLPQVEEVFETEDGLYDVRGTIYEPSKLVDSVAERVRFAFDLTVQSNASDLNEMSTAAKLLRHVLDNCLDDPNAMEYFFRQASALIKDGIKRGIFGEDDTLDVLTRTLDEVALQMRSDHPDVAAAVDARTKQSLREIGDAKRLQAAEMIEDLREGTIARLNTELALAAETTRDGSCEEATAEAMKQSGNRAGKISIEERAKKAESSGAMAGLKMALRADKLVEFVTGLISGGGAV